MGVGEGRQGTQAAGYQGRLVVCSALVCSVVVCNVVVCSVVVWSFDDLVVYSVVVS